MKKKILLTRPRSASLRWADLLTQHGLDSVVEPLLHITPTILPRPAGSYQAVIITSANAPEALIAQKEKVSDLLGLPCFCVGASTGASAQVLGFTDIKYGTADSATLAYLVTGTLIDKTLPLLHIAGDIVDSKAHEILTKAGFAIETWQVYGATAAQGFTDTICDLLKSGDVSFIPVFSPRTAHILVGLIEKHRLVPACHSLTAIGLSQAVADVLQKLPWRRLCVAATPSEEGVLTCLLSESAMPDAPPVPPPIISTPAAPYARKKRCFMWKLLAILILSGAGAVTLVQCPWFINHLTAKENAQVAQNIAALEDRVRMLESRIDTQQAQPTPAENNDATLADTVKTLQVQIAQIQSKDDTQQAAQKWVAAALAFWDLRNVANEGRAFTTQLAAFHDATENDADIAAQTSVLFSYAAGVSTLAQLHDELAAHEPVAEPIATEEETMTLQTRLKKTLGNLISVHPLHQVQFDTLEQALVEGNNNDVEAAFNALPDSTKQKLSVWQAKLQSRIAVDNALHALATHFTASPAQGEKP